MATRGRGLSGGLLTKNNNNSSRLPKLRAGGENYGDSSGFDIGICSAQGRRPYQEDEFAILTFLNRQHSDPTLKIPDTHLFGVFDGHAGGRCSKAISLAIPENLVKDPKFDAKLAQALRGAFSKSNENFLKIAERMRLNDGSTAVCCVLRYLKLVVANVGDSRAILISGNKAHQITTDHKPSSPDEQRRIASIGGSVVNCMGVARVNGILAVSRAFGNFGIRHVIRPDADIFERDLTSEDDFLVLASDGLWDVLRNKDVCDICYSLKSQGVNAQKISEELVKQALTLGSMDNTTCMVIGIHEYYLQTKELLDKMIKSSGSGGGTGDTTSSTNFNLSSTLPVNMTTNLTPSGSNSYMDQTIDYDATLLADMMIPPSSSTFEKTNKKNSSHLFALNTNLPTTDIVNQRYSPLAAANTNYSTNQPRPPVVGQVILQSNSMSVGEKPPINPIKYTTVAGSSSTNSSSGMSPIGDNNAIPILAATTAIDESSHTHRKAHYTGYAAPRLLSGNTNNNNFTSNTEESKSSTGTTPPIIFHSKSSLSTPSTPNTQGQGQGQGQGNLDTNLNGESFRAKYTIQSQKLQHNILASTLPLTSSATTTTTSNNNRGNRSTKAGEQPPPSSTNSRNEAQKLRQTMNNSSDAQHNSLPRSAPSSSFSNGLRSTAGSNALRQDNLQSSGTGNSSPPSLFVGKAGTNKGIGFVVEPNPNSTVGPSTGNRSKNTSNSSGRMNGKMAVDDSPQYSEGELSNTDNTVMMFSKRKHAPSSGYR